MKRLLIIICLLPIFCNSQICKGRYDVQEIFKSYDSLTYKYGENKDYRDTLVKLFLTVYKPKGDTVTLRPCVVFCHGGNFASTTYVAGRLVGGNRNSFEINLMAKYLAKRGHVVATIDYRLDHADSLKDNPQRAFTALVRGIQDANASIRFLKSKWDSLAVDTNKFFLGGISIGGVIALTKGYSEYSDFDSAQRSWIDPMPGGLFGNTNAIDKDNEVLGLFSFSGGVLDTGDIGAFELPVYLNHERFDTIMPYYTGATQIGKTWIPINGSGDIKWRKDSFGNYCKMDSFDNVFHPSLAYIWRLEQSQANLNRFLWEVLRCDLLSIKDASYDASTNFYPNPADDFLTIETKKKSNTIEISNLIGQTIYRYSGFEKSLNISEISPGIYILKINEKVLKLIKN
jgi:hypothetical protein